MGGNRPKNHISAKYVIVIDRRQGFIYYYALDKFGVLIYENGQPKLEYVFPYIQTENNGTNEENNVENTENVGNIGSPESIEGDQEVEIKAPMIQENEENAEDSDADGLTEFQFYDEFNYENPFGLDCSWDNYDFAF